MINTQYDMIIRSFKEDDFTKYGISCDIPWADVEKELSMIMLTDDEKVECYIILEKEGNKCPKKLYDEEMWSYRIADLYVADTNPFGGTGVTNFIRLFLLILSHDDNMSFFWIKKSHPYAKILEEIDVEEDGRYFVYYKSMPYTIY